jgi:hypothetical protein
MKFTIAASLGRFIIMTCYTDSGICVSLSTKSEKASRLEYTMIWIYIGYQPDVCNVLILPKCESHRLSVLSTSREQIS